MSIASGLHWQVDSQCSISGPYMLAQEPVHVKPSADGASAPGGDVGVRLLLDAGPTQATKKRVKK